MGIVRKQRRWDLSPAVERFVSSFTYSCLSVAISDILRKVSNERKREGERKDGKLLGEKN